MKIHVFSTLEKILLLIWGDCWGAGDDLLRASFTVCDLGSQSHKAPYSDGPCECFQCFVVAILNFLIFLEKGLYIFILHCALQIVWTVLGLGLKFMHYLFSAPFKLNCQVLFTLSSSFEMRMGYRVRSVTHSCPYSTIYCPTIHTANYIPFHPFNPLYAKGGKVP